MEIVLLSLRVSSTAVAIGAVTVWPHCLQVNWSELPDRPSRRRCTWAQFGHLTIAAMGTFPCLPLK